MKSISAEKNKTRILFIILTIVCMTVIFLFSSEPSNESSQTSGKIVKLILRVIVPDFSIMAAAKQSILIHNAQFIVRKAAHFTIYTVLGFVLSMSFGRRKFLTGQTAIALTAGALYAVTDELHQSLIPGRSCELRDIIIDSCGVFTGIVISMAVMHIISCAVRHRKCKN